MVATVVGDGSARSSPAPVAPGRWNGTLEDLPAGIDGAIARGLDEAGANVLCAMVIQIPRGLQGRGLSATALGAMADIARAHGFDSLIAPVRPSWKDATR